MLQILKTQTFDKWLSGLRDGNAVARITRRIDRLAAGNPGDAKLLKETGGIYEMRIDYGPGYRMYYMQRGKTVLLLLCGGDKRTQTADIAHAMKLATT